MTLTRRTPASSCGIVLLAVLTAACSSPPAEVDVRNAQRLSPVFRPGISLTAGAVVAPDSGQLDPGSTMSIWRSTAATPRAVHVYEEISYSPWTRGLRRYEFDSTGTLVYFTERERYAVGRGDSVRDGGYGRIEFAGGKPVMLSRVSSVGTRMRYARHELHNIAKRGDMLWDSAVVAAR